VNVSDEDGEEVRKPQPDWRGDGGGGKMRALAPSGIGQDVEDVGGAGRKRREDTSLCATCTGPDSYRLIC